MSDSRQQISALIHLYAERMDDGDFAGVGALFEDAGYGAEGGPEARGSAAVERALREAVVLHDDGTPRTRHVTTNLVVQVDEQAGSAEARSTFTVFQATQELALQPIVLGRYQDRFQRGNGGWRFAQRRIRMELVGDVRHHLRGNSGRS